MERIRGREYGSGDEESEFRMEHQVEWEDWLDRHPEQSAVEVPMVAASLEVQEVFLFLI